MNAALHSVKLGFERGGIEFKQFLRNPQEMIWVLIMSLIFLVVLWFQRNKEVEGLSLALLTLPSLLGMTIANAFTGAAGTLSYDREDGTLLRAKAIPQGMIGYLVARLLYIVYTTLLGMLILFLPASIFVDGLLDVSIAGLFAFVWLFTLGLLATEPFGAVIGSLVKSSSSGFGLTFLPFAGLVAISGIFYPITALAGWLQLLAQFFPIYWLGHGMRYVFLPETAAAEIGGEWRLGIGALVLGTWAIIGALIAPRILRRMAKRESGSNMEARRQQVVQRGY